MPTLQEMLAGITAKDEEISQNIGPLVSAGGQATPTAQAPVPAGGSPTPVVPTADAEKKFDLTKFFTALGQGLQIVGATAGDVNQALRTGTPGTKGAQLQRGFEQDRQTALRTKAVSDQFQLEFDRKQKEFSIREKRLNAESKRRQRTATMTGLIQMGNAIPDDDPRKEQILSQVENMMMDLATDVGEDGGVLRKAFVQAPLDVRREFLTRMTGITTAPTEALAGQRANEALKRLDEMENVPPRVREALIQKVVKALKDKRADLKEAQLEIEKVGDRAFERQPDGSFKEVISAKPEKSLERIRQEAEAKRAPEKTPSAEDNNLNEQVGDLIADVQTLRSGGSIRSDDTAPELLAHARSLVPKIKNPALRKDAQALVNDVTKQKTAGLKGGALIGPDGFLRPSATNSIRVNVGTVFGGVFDPQTRSIQGLNPESRERFRLVTTETERILLAGEEKSIAGAINVALRNLDINLIGAKTTTGKTTPGKSPTTDSVKKKFGLK